VLVEGQGIQGTTPLAGDARSKAPPMNADEH
jgi:hypothetical protein